MALESMSRDCLSTWQSYRLTKGGAQNAGADASRPDTARQRCGQVREPSCEPSVPDSLHGDRTISVV